MTECHDLNEIKKQDKQLYKYMFHELAMMYTISTIFLYASNDPVNFEKEKELWRFLKEKDAALYRKMRLFTINALTHFPGRVGRWIAIKGYRIVQKIFKVN